jgi:hypothetical protein
VKTGLEAVEGLLEAVGHEGKKQEGAAWQRLPKLKPQKPPRAAALSR